MSKNNIESIAKAFSRACQVYSQERKKKYPDLSSNDPSRYWVLFVIDEHERNICDQKWIETAAYERYGIRSMRLTLQQTLHRVKRDEETGILYIDGKFEVALVYYRTGY